MQRFELRPDHTPSTEKFPCFEKWPWVVPLLSTMMNTKRRTAGQGAPTEVQPRKSQEVSQSAAPTKLDSAATAARQRLACHHNKLHMSEIGPGVLQGFCLQMSGMCKGRLETLIWAGVLPYHADRPFVTGSAKISGLKPQPADPASL